MTKTQGNFRLRVVEGEFTDSQIVVMLGENGTGKTTFIRMLVFFLFITFVFFAMFSCLSYYVMFSCLSYYGSLAFLEDELFYWLNLQAGLLKPDSVEGTDVEIPEFNVSYKPQKISPRFQSTVRSLLHQKIRDSYMHPQFMSDVMKPLLIEQLMDQEVVNLSGGELQRVALCLCLGKVIRFLLYTFLFIVLKGIQTV
jgi:ATP-binding cassette subfamily E protein 1